MLKNKTRSISYQATAFVGEEPVLSLSATIPSTTGVGSIGQHVQNQELYTANRASLRSDISEFQDEVWAIEDSMILDAPLGDQTPV